MHYDFKYEWNDLADSSVILRVFYHGHEKHWVFDADVAPQTEREKRTVERVCAQVMVTALTGDK